MAFMTVTLVVSDINVDQLAIQAALKLVEQNGGHLDLLCLGIDHTHPGLVAASPGMVLPQSNVVQATKAAQELEAAIKEQLQPSNVSWASSALTVHLAGLSATLAHQMRFSDLAVFALPYGKGRTRSHEAALECALFDAGIPVFAVPDDAQLQHPIKRIVLAWNDSREALNAVRLALPMMQMAESVNIVMVAPPIHALDRSDPGGSLAKMLSRHGVKAEISVLAKTMPRVSDVIARHVVDQNADLLIMGAYGHSRIRESILGGATRNILETTQLPLFLAH
ncbi:MAG: universal stress protein [Paracoccaceae bacterium]